MSLNRDASPDPSPPGATSHGSLPAETPSPFLPTTDRRVSVAKFRVLDLEGNYGSAACDMSDMIAFIVDLAPMIVKSETQGGQSKEVQFTKRPDRLEPHNLPFYILMLIDCNNRACILSLTDHVIYTRLYINSSIWRTSDQVPISHLVEDVFYTL